MRVSEREIRESNRTYYFKTYAQHRTRRHFWLAPMCVILICLTAGTVEYLCSWHIFLRQAGREMVDMEVVDWVRAELLNGLIFHVICISTGVCMAVLLIWLFYCWKYIKSYELYKWKRRLILIPVVIVLANFAVVVAGLIFLSRQQMLESGIIVSTLASLCTSFWPLLKAARLLIPWEVTPLENDDGPSEFFWTFCDTLAKRFLKNR